MVAAAAEAGAPVAAVARKSRTSGATREAVAAALPRPALVPLCQAPPEPQEARLVAAAQMERCHLYVFHRLARHRYRHLHRCRRRAHHHCLGREPRLARNPHLAQGHVQFLGHFRRHVPPRHCPLARGQPRRHLLARRRLYQSLLRLSCSFRAHRTSALPLLVRLVMQQFSSQAGEAAMVMVVSTQAGRGRASLSSLDSLRRRHG
jgi:hypothetical protein